MAEESDQQLENANKIITWEVINNETARKQLTDDTLSEEVLQNLDSVHFGIQNLGNSDTKLPDAQKKLDGLVDAVRQQLRGLQRLQRLDPDQPIPIDHKYEKGGGNPMIALELVPEPPDK